MPSEFVLNIEKHLAHIAQTHFPNPYAKNMKGTRAFMRAALRNYFRPGKDVISVNRSYHVVDFEDFLDYSTSEIVETDYSQIPDQNILFYDALPGSFDEELIESDRGPISIIGCALGRYKQSITICIKVMLRGKEFFPEMIEHESSKQMFSQEDAFHYYLCLLTLKQENKENEWYEYSRIRLFPPISSGKPEYGYAFRFYEKSKEFSEFQRVLTKEQIADSDSIIDAHKLEFELARLMLNLPGYIDFMYDLVINEKREAKKSGHPKKKKKQKKSSPDQIIYKIIKSVKISYEAEKKTRAGLKDKPRKWTAPSFKYIVQGHWRTLQHPWSKGHHPDGSEVLGKTWVSGYEKGINEKQKIIREVVSKDPGVVINIKQTLAHGRDILKTQQPSKEKHLKQESFSSLTEHEREKPTDEWIYDERKKLTAGLRYLIIRRDGFRCKLCGASGTDEGIKLEVDHVIPVIKWGKTEESNLQTLCRECNRGKSTIT